MDTPIEGGESSSFRNSEEKCLQRVTGPGIFRPFRTLRLLPTYSHGQLYRNRCTFRGRKENNHGIESHEHE